MSSYSEIVFIKNKLIELEKKTNAIIYANIQQNQQNQNNKTIDAAKFQLFTEKLQELEELIDSFPQDLDLGPVFQSISGTGNAKEAVPIINKFTADGSNLISVIKALKTLSTQNQETLNQLVTAHNKLIQALISGNYTSNGSREDQTYTVTPEKFSNSTTGKNSVLGSVLASNSNGSSLIAPTTVSLNSTYQTSSTDPYSKIINSYITTETDNVLNCFQIQ